MAKKSETIKKLLEDVSIDEKIPLPNVTGKVLSSLFTITNDSMVNPNLSLKDHKTLMAKRNETLSLKDYVDLLAARNYLDIELVHQILFEGLLDNLTLKVVNLKSVLGDSQLPPEFKVKIINELAKQAHWNGKIVAEFFSHTEVPLVYRRLIISELQKNSSALKVTDLVEVLASPEMHDTFKKEIIVEFARRSKKLDIALAKKVYGLTKISLAYRIFIIKELIKNNRALLQEVVGMMPMVYKESRDRGEDPEEGGFYFPEASGDAEKLMLEEMKSALGNHYTELIKSLEKEYPEPL